MKILFLFAALLCSCYATAQITVTVDPTVIIKKLNGNENGINLNYLTDDSYTDSISSTTAALKKMGVKMLRYPGGEKSDNYLFSGYPWTTSSPRMATTDARSWPTSNPDFVDQDSEQKLCKENVLDFDEMVQMAKEIEAEPLIVLAYDVMYLTYSSGASAIKPTKAELIEHAVEWVRYANIKKKYNVKYWMIGNESWGDPDYNGETTPAQYALDVYEFATAMKAVDPTIKIIVNGERSWWSTLLRSPAMKLIDILAFSNYPVWDYKGGYSYFKNNNVVLTEEVDAAISAIDRYTTGADRERLKVLPSEYNAIDWSGSWENVNDIGHALCNFQMFGDILLKPKVEALCSWNTRWTNIKEDSKSIYNVLDDKSNLNATGIAMEIWGKNLLNTMVKAVSNNTKIKSYASYDTLSGALNILIMNKDSINHTINVNLEKYDAKYGGSKMAFTGISPKDAAPSFKWKEAITRPENLYNVELQATSITVVKLFSPYITLPIHLKSFTGVNEKDKIKLTWHIENEEGLTQFEVEREKQNKEFIKIGNVNATRNKSNYNFVDFEADFKEDNNYRLKLVYNNGTIKYSDVVVVSSKDWRGFEVKMFPNPFNDNSQLQVISTVKKKLAVKAFDQSGNLVLSKSLITPQGISHHTLLDVSNLKSGVFFLQIEGDGILKHLKFMKQ